MGAPKVFLSYARADDEAKDKEESSLVRAFFDDLRDEIRREHTGDPPGMDGSFIDVAIPFGALWEKHLHDAAAAADVLVALTSPTYYRREWCGREWAIFVERGATKGDAARRIMPLSWTGKAPRHAVAAPHQLVFDNENRPEVRDALAEYELRGLQWLVRYRNEAGHRVTYGLVLRTIANAVVAAAKVGDLPALAAARAPTIAPLFPAPAKRPATARDGAPSTAYFAALVGAADRIANVEIQPRYASDSWGWTPFVPESSEQLGVTLTRVAAEAGLRPLWLDEHADLPAVIRKAEAVGVIVIVVVDPWSTELDECLARAQKLDAELFDNCSIIVVWSDEPEHAPGVAESLRQNALRRLARRQLLVEANDQASFVQRLTESINTLNRALASLRTPSRSLPPGERTALPTVNAAGGTEKVG